MRIDLVLQSLNLAFLAAENKFLLISFSLVNFIRKLIDSFYRLVERII